jgi:hypothetical protein
VRLRRAGGALGEGAIQIGADAASRQIVGQHIRWTGRCFRLFFSLP